MKAQFNTEPEIGRALLTYVVKLPSGKRPSLEITTPSGVFYLVTIEGSVFPIVKNGDLTFISFVGRQPIGRAQTFVWPSEEVEEPALGITGLEVYGN